MTRSVRRRLLIPLIAALFLVWAPPREAEAAPDPVVASMLSVGAMALPLTLTAILWGTGQGKSEGIRFDVGIVSLGLGATLAPSVGQMYAGGGTDALVTFLLRAVTSAVMLTGVGFRLRGPENRQTMGLALAITGGVPTALLAIYDIYAAYVTAKEARYKEGYGRVKVPPELLSVAVCGPIPCSTAGTSGPMWLGPAATRATPRPQVPSVVAAAAVTP